MRDLPGPCQDPTNQGDIVNVVVLALIIVGAVLAGIALIQSKATSLTAWGLLAVAGALLIERL